MVQRKMVEFIDDLDGTPAHATVHFALGDRIYAIDLNDDHITALEDVLAPFIRHARRVDKLPNHPHRPIKANALKAGK